MDKISYEAIKLAFVGDSEIQYNCDPDNPDKSQIGVVEDVYRKLIDYEDLFIGNFIVLNDDGKDVGFVYCLPGLLISFGVNKSHRTKGFLPKVFDTIQTAAGDNFYAYMWSRNERAVRWLKRCGMEEEYFENKEIKKLRYNASYNRLNSGRGIGTLSGD
jgi:hypothetical protein